MTFTGPTSSGPLLGPDLSFGEAEAAADALQTRVDPVFDATGPFPFAALPTDGTATYNGIIEGSGLLFAEIPWGYYADLELTADFETASVSGQATNFLLNLTIPEDPAGSIPLSGSLNDVSGDAGIQFEGSGGITGANVTLSGSGVLGGPGGSVAKGVADATFILLEIPFNGLELTASGTWRAE